MAQVMCFLQGNEINDSDELTARADAAVSQFNNLGDPIKAAYPAYRKARAEMQEYLVAQKAAAVLLEKKEQEAVEERRKQEQRTDQHR